jgi:hypothetical protein
MQMPAQHGELTVKLRMCTCERAIEDAKRVSDEEKETKKTRDKE